MTAVGSTESNRATDIGSTESGRNTAPGSAQPGRNTDGGSTASGGNTDAASTQSGRNTDVGAMEPGGNTDVGSTESANETDERTRIVGAGYDQMADTWESWSAAVTDDPRAAWLEALLELLPADASVVELGCGNGSAETRELADRGSLVGVDISEEQLRRARDRVPEATFLQGDLTTIELEPGSVDAVVAFYVFNHVPRELLAGVFARIHGWLRPGGHFLASLGAGDVDAWTGDWLGVPMFFSSFPPATNTRLLRDAGFELLRDETVTITEPEGAVTFQWVLARR